MNNAFCSSQTLLFSPEKPGPFYKSQIPSTPPKRRRAGKSQTSSKLQAPRQKDGGQANFKQITNSKSPAKKTADRQIPNRG
jgi:hypothetical protein